MARGSLEDGEIPKKALGPNETWAAKVETPLPDTKWRKPEGASRGVEWWNSQTGATEYFPEENPPGYPWTLVVQAGSEPKPGSVSYMSLRAKTPSDTEIAESLRLKLAPKLVEVAAIMNEAQAHSMIVQFNIGIGPSGKHMVGPIVLVKHL